MIEKVRWGVIGCGGIAARRTIPEFRKMVSKGELISVMDIDAKRAKQVAEHFLIQHYCTTERELFAQGIDAVYIATPAHLHCSQTLLAAESGKHILCEKPMTLSLQEADRMQAACLKAGVKFMIGFCMRNNVYNRKCRELVHSGALGQMVSGRAQLTGWYPPVAGAWRQERSISGGGSLIDMGVHCLDLLEWIMGTKIVEVVALQDQITHRYPTKIEDTSTVLLRFSNRAHGIVDNYFNVPDAASLNRLELYGTNGSILAEGCIGQDPTGQMFSITEPQTTYDASQVREIQGKRREYHFKGIGLYGQMIDIFSECILNDREPPVTLEDGRHSVAAVEAIYESVTKGAVVRVAN